MKASSQTQALAATVNPKMRISRMTTGARRRSAPEPMSFGRDPEHAVEDPGVERNAAHGAYRSTGGRGPRAIIPASAVTFSSLPGAVCDSSHTTRSRSPSSRGPAMNQDLKRLVHLQDLMQAVETVGEKIAAVPVDVARLEKDLLAAQQEVETMRGTLSDLQRERRRLEAELMGI